MPYSDPQFEARRKSIIAGTSNQQTPTISQPTRTTGFIDQRFEQRRASILNNQVALPPITPSAPVIDQPQGRSLGSKVSRFFGVETGELGNAANRVKDFVTADREAIAPEDVINFGKVTLGKLKNIIAGESEKYAQKQDVYRLEQGIPDYQELSYDQVRDMSSVGMLKLSREDIEVDLKELEAKENKKWIDNYRIKNMKDTIAQIDETLALKPEERSKKETFINGLALARVSGNVASGFLGSLAGLGDFIKWRGDVAEAESVAGFGETAATHLKQWADAVAPDNPELADELLQGAGSTLAFYLPGAGVSGATAKLATISPRLAAVFGVAASATLEAGTESGNTYVEMLESGASREDADLAASRVFAGNIVFNVITDKIGLFSDAEGVKKVLTTALAEGSQEAYQDGLQAVTQGKELNGDQLGKTFFIGAVVGGGMGSVVQQASVSEDINEADRKKLADLADKIRQVENGADPEALGFGFVQPAGTGQEVNFVDPAIYAESIYGTPGGTRNINDIPFPEYAQGEIDPTQVQIVESQIENGDPVNPIVLDQDGNVLDGANRLTAFKNMGVQNVATVVQGEGGQQFDYGSTQLDLPTQVASEFRDFANSIPEATLYKDPQANYSAQQTGRELDPHITVLYGLSEVKQDAVRKIVEPTNPIEVELGEVSVFETDNGYDVLKVDVISDQLAALNKRIDDALDAPGNTFDEYRPHVTIGYVKKGQGASYVGDTRFEGQKITLDNLTFSTKDGKRINIPLTGKEAEIGVSETADQTTETTQKTTKKTSSTQEGVSVTQKQSADSQSRETTPKKKVKARSRLKQFASVVSGLTSKGAEKIHNFELRKPPKAGTEEFKLHKRITDLIRKYAQTIGEGYTPRNALGVYFPKTKNIRVNNMNNVTVAAHEIAHFLDYAHGITDKLINAKDLKIQNQIEKIYQQYYPTARPDHQKRLQALEGFATLLQKYTEQPTTITNEYPDLVKEFLQPKGKYYTEVIGEIITDLNQMIGEYQGLSALDKIGARVTSEGTNINKGSFLNFWQKFRTQLADEVYPVEVLAKKGKVSFTKEDPSLWIRAYNAVSGIVNNNISTDRGYWAFTDAQNGWQKKYDYNWKSLVESTQRRGVTDSFAHYLVARREYYMYQELDQLQAQKEQVEKIVEAFAKVDPEKMAEFDRDLRATLAEDYGIDLTEQDYNRAKKNLQQLFDRFNKAYLEQKEILDNDGFSREDIEAAYAENKDVFKDEETMFDALTREDLNLLFNPEVQLINRKTYEKLKKQDGYASFKRQFYDEIVGDLDAPGAIRVGGTKVSSLIGRKGSERTIINPLYSALANHSEIVKKSMKQVVYNQVGKLGSSALMPNLMQEVQLKTTVDKNTGAISYPQEKDNNVIMARRNYKRVPILMDGEVKGIVDMLLTHKNIDTFTQLYTGLSRMFTAGTTGLYPQFALTNFVVDQITATANSYNGYKALYSPMATMRKALQKNGKTIEAKYYDEYLVMGGERQTFTGWQRLEPKDLFKRISSEKNKMEAAIEKMNQGIDILSIPAAKSEIFSRATEYINARKAGKSQIVALEEAGRVTAPFHHIGAWGAKEGKRSFGQTYIRGLPFFNAGIQVLDQTARVASTPQGRKNMTFVTIAVTAAYLSSIMAMMDASDDQKEQYKDLEADDLANFIYYPNPSGQGLIRIKMANTFSIPGTVINMAIANRVFGAKNNAKDVLEAATAFLPAQFNPTDPTAAILGWIPQVFKPTAHVIFNVKEYPTVTSLVSQGLQRKPAALQYNEGTSTFAKKIGELLNISPIKVDYLLTGYLGRASGFLTGKPGIYNPASSIMRDYYFTGGKRVREFYDLKEKNDGEYTAYQNLEKGYENLPKERVEEIYRVKVITGEIDDLLGTYRDVDPEKEPEKAAELRAKILVHIEQLENGTKPKGLSQYTFEAKKRRRKNEISKK